MDKQTKNIKLLKDGSIRFKNSRVEMPKNEVLSMNKTSVTFALNGNRTGKVDTADYFRLSLWAHRMTFDHADSTKGVIAYDNGFEHKSLAAAIMHTPSKKKVCYANKDRSDCRQTNLVVTDNNYK